MKSTLIYIFFLSVVPACYSQEIEYQDTTVYSGDAWLKLYLTTEQKIEVKDSIIHVYAWPTRILMKGGSIKDYHRDDRLSISGSGIRLSSHGDGKYFMSWSVRSRKFRISISYSTGNKSVNLGVFEFFYEGRIR
ncbi:MAG: hypothetical protein WDZ35_15175 [Crocinitomicaceae bacterium]